jgi:hypothetical protein
VFIHACIIGGLLIAGGFTFFRRADTVSGLVEAICMVLGGIALIAVFFILTFLVGADSDD